jgi:urea transport system permease protein
MMTRLQQMHSPLAWFFVLTIATIGIVGVPLLNLTLDANSSFHLPDYVIPLLGKFLCYALVALAMDLIWGYAGILSLGHGVFFALGGYAMGMYLMRSMSGLGRLSQ